MSMADNFVTALNASCDQFRAMIINFGVHQRCCWQVQLIEKFETAPRTNAVAIFAPAVIQNIRLRRCGCDGGPEPFTESKMFKIETNIHRQSRTVRPAKIWSPHNRYVIKS